MKVLASTHPRTVVVAIEGHAGGASALLFALPLLEEKAEKTVGNFVSVAHKSNHIFYTKV